MNDTNPNPDGVRPDKSAGRRKRAAPTIDLEAKEIPSAGTPETAVPEAAAREEDSATPQPAATVEPAAADGTSAADEPATAAPPRSALGGAAFASSAPPGDAPPPERSGALKPLVIGGIAGAAAATIVIAIGWSAGLFATDQTATPDPRVAALETQIKQLQSRPAAPAASTGATDALAARIAKVEDSVSKISAAPADDNALKSLGVALAALNRRYDELATNLRETQSRAAAAEKAAADLRRNVQDVSKTAAAAGASSADVASLQQRLTALEEQSKAARAELAKATASDKSARLALSAAAVRNAVLRGAPFAEELAQAKALGADEKALAPLWPFAASGVPNTKMLAKELTDLLPQMKKAVGTPAASGSFLERLQANAEHLVRVRPADAPAGNDAAAVLARIEQSAAQENIAAALADIGTLPEAARQVAANWVTRATARQKALDAARDLATGTTRALGSK